MYLVPLLSAKIRGITWFHSLTHKFILHTSCSTFSLPNGLFLALCELIIGTLTCPTVGCYVSCSQGF